RSLTDDMQQTTERRSVRWTFEVVEGSGRITSAAPTAARWGGVGLGGRWAAVGGTGNRRGSGGGPLPPPSPGGVRHCSSPDPRGFERRSGLGVGAAGTLSKLGRTTLTFSSEHEKVRARWSGHPPER